MSEWLFLLISPFQNLDSIRILYKIFIFVNKHLPNRAQVPFSLEITVKPMLIITTPPKQSV